MAEVNMEQAKRAYQKVCDALDAMELNYNKHEEDLVITFGHRGEDMNHDLILMVNAKQEVIQLVEKMPFKVNRENAANFAVALCAINDKLLNGKFTYNFEENICFEVTHIISGDSVSTEAVKRMILSLVFSVEEYDDKLMALNKGYIKATDFINNEE